MKNTNSKFFMHAKSSEELIEAFNNIWPVKLFRTIYFIGLIIIALSLFIWIWVAFLLAVKLFFTGLVIVVITAILLRIFKMVFENEVLGPYEKQKEQENINTPEKKSKWVQRVEEALKDKEQNRKYDQPKTGYKF